MNFLQSPPNHYPNSHDSTLEVFRTRNFSVTTNASSPPGYHAERAPPRYQEVTEAERGEHNTEEGAKKARKIRWVRVASSIFIVTTVSLIVAGVVGKINGMKADSGHGERHDGSSTTLITVSTEETAHPSTEEIPSTTVETAGPGITASNLNSGDLKALVQDEAGTRKNDEDRGHDSKSDPPDPPSTADSVADRDTESTCGIVLRSLEESTRRHNKRYVSDTLSLIGCLASEDSFKKRALLDEICDYACMFEKLAQEPRMDEWEWDSG